MGDAPVSDIVERLREKQAREVHEADVAMQMGLGLDASIGAWMNGGGFWSMLSEVRWKCLGLNW